MHECESDKCMDGTHGLKSSLEAGEKGVVVVDDERQRDRKSVV